MASVQYVDDLKVFWTPLTECFGSANGTPEVHNLLLFFVVLHKSVNFSSGSFSLFRFHVCLCYAVLSASSSLVITCWQMADLLALLVSCFLVFLSLSHMVSWVRCGT